MTRALRQLSLATSLVLLTAAPAAATFHLMKIVEVFPGTAADPAAQYVMLQMFFPGQNLVNGHSLSIFDGAGMPMGTFTFGADVSNGADLATILIATPDAQALFGIMPDLTMSAAIDPAGGAACWDVVDCVAWGNFSAPAALPGALETTFNAPAGLVLGMAMHRDLSSGGAVTPFALAPPAPTNNAGQSGALGCIGDCNGDGQVTVDEILTMADIALGNMPVTQCDAGDANHDGSITVDEILTAVDNALNGCSAAAPVATPTTAPSPVIFPPPYPYAR